MSAPWPDHFPSEPENFGKLHVGDIHDDDAQIIDDDLREVDNAPDPVAEPIPYASTKDTIKRHTRLTPISINVDPAWSTPTLLIPANPDRTGLQIKATSATPTATDYVAIGSDPGQLQNVSNVAGKLFHGQTLSLDYHTGAVWVTAGASAGVINVSAWETAK